MGCTAVGTSTFTYNLVIAYQISDVLWPVQQQLQAQQLEAENERVKVRLVVKACGTTAVVGGMPLVRSERGVWVQPVAC